jgi:hypothetical protein
MQPQMELTKPQEPAVETSMTVPQPGWAAATKLGFRFAFCYFLLYCVPFPLGTLPYTEKPAEWYEALWQKVVPWVGQHLLHLAQPITIFTNGSGDTTYDYVKVLCFVFIAAAAALLWSGLDRRRENYRQLHHWLRFYLRLVLGATLLSYGAYKVIPSQFPPLWQYRYLMTYGESSPMGILWTFMSASKSYTIFAGAIEMLAGTLLFVPRLTTLGALISIGAMTNVFMLNMSYDVPVKLYSFHLLLLSIFLILPELDRITRFFILNRATGPAAAELRFSRPWLNRSFLFGQFALGLLFAGSALYASHRQLKSFVGEEFAVKPPLHGAWAVDEFEVDGQARPPLLTDNVRWQRVIFGMTSGIMVQAMDGKLLRYGAKIDFDKKTLDLSKRDDKQWEGNLAYAFPANDVMSMDGQLGGQKVHLKLHHLDGKYLLNTRGFHWINEFPLNR